MFLIKILENGPLKISVVALLLGVAPPARASSSGAGSIVEMLAHREGRLFFNTTGARDAKPACALYNRWVVDGATPKGQALVALVPSAQMANKKIYVTGTGACEDWSDTEAVNFVQVVD